ncbi:MAG: TetR/AcrR family transcriptional regulator [Saprospiraceae bacterium]
MISRKEEIKKAAARLFRKRGYKATSMRDIAEAVGIKAASIYNHIKSKQELLSGLLMEIATIFTKEMELIQNTSLDAQKKLERLIALHVKLTIEYTDAIALIAGEWVHLEEHEKQQYITLRDSYENQFTAIIEQGKSEGLFKNIETEIILFSTLSTLRWLYSWYSRNRSFNPIDLEQQITECLMNGFLVIDNC